MNRFPELAALAAGAVRHETPCGDGTLVWRAWGPAGGRPTVLLHGGSGSWTHWVRNVAPLAAAGRRVLVPDMPGFGESAPPPDGHDADALPRWLERGVQALVGGGPVDLVGFSFGGLAGGLWADEVPARVARLVLVGAPGLSGEPIAPLDLRRWDRVPEGPARDAVHRHNLLQLMLAHEATADALAVALHAANVAADRMLRRKLMRTAALVPVLPRLRCTVGGLWGAADVLVRDRLPLVGRVLSTAPRFTRVVVVPGAGHWVPYEAADAFNAALAALLDAEPGPQAGARVASNAISCRRLSTSR
jgi:pimeloyl-ACP methyl ester carboxylesterase